MKPFSEFWQGLDRAGRIGLVLGIALIAATTILVGMWALHTDYQVLFSDLSAQDAATMVAELDRTKIPYELGSNGNTILVPADLVYKTRLKLTGQDLPLHGAVGLELFNNSEIGMTEFSQRINYQRALQGELTRTILSLDEVENARVHLVLPEQTLFRKNTTHAKAAITITVKPGQSLAPNQVQGIQRLVSAAVPGIHEEDVTIVDQRGVALTRRTGTAGEDAVAVADNLDDKRAIETYLSRKVSDVLDRMFGSGQGLASVDVTLSPDFTKVTTEDVLPGNTSSNGTNSGIIVRERTSKRGVGRDEEAGHTGTTSGGQANREVDYQVGRRVEQVITHPGAVSQINVAVVLRHPLSPQETAHLKELIAAAAGINKSRGDAVAIYGMDQVPAATDASTVASAAIATGQNAAKTMREVAPQAAASSTRQLIPAALAIAAAAIMLAYALGRRRTASSGKFRRLTLNERERVLLQVREWLAQTPEQTMERER